VEEKCWVMRGVRVMSGMSGGDVVSYKHVIVEFFEGGFCPYHLWAQNPPQVATYPSNNTMVPIVGPLYKINV
jgi:hypothetical protein